MSIAATHASTGAVLKPRRARTRLATTALVWALFWALNLGLQFAGGAYEQRGFSTEPDEPAHYMSGLLIRDYAAAGFPRSPMAYATSYYEHHPSMAIGYWPPLFYLVEGAWMLVFGITRQSALVLMALICAAVQLLIYLRARRPFGAAAAFSIALTFALFPVVRRAAGMVMTDLFVTLLTFAATLLFGRLLLRPRIRSAVAFGVVTGLAFLTKLTAGLLVFLPPLSVALSRRWSVLRKPAFWIPPVLAGALYLPWWLWAGRFAGVGLLPVDMVNHFFTAWKEYAELLLRCAGIAIAAAGVLGGLWIVKARDPRWVVLAAQPLAVGGLLSVGPVQLDERYVIAALPTILLVALFGISRLADRVALAGRFRAAALAAAVPLLAAPVILSAPLAAHPPQGLARAADALMAMAEPQAVMLVSSSEIVDVHMVAALAAREPARPGRRTIRAAKLLADVDWNATRYRARCSSEAEVISALSAHGVRYVMLESIKGRRQAPHNDQLAAALRDNPDRWLLTDAEEDIHGRWLIYSALR